MSDLPPNAGDNSSENDVGWHQPASPGTWHTPEKPQVIGWRVPALPKELDEDPVETGVWHLPKEQDTTFRAEDETDIVRSEDDLPTELPAEGKKIAPEDAVLIPAPEDILNIAQAAEKEIASQVQPDEGVKAPEDWMNMLEHIDEEDDDQPTGAMSELIALANLQSDAVDLDIEVGDQLDIEGVDEAPDDSGHVDVSQLSPAERAFAQQEELTDGVTGLSAAEYARQQMAQLQGDSGGTSFGDDSAMDDSGSIATPDDPEAYARARLAELQQGSDVAQDFVQPPQVDPLNPREQDLLRKFRETESQVQQLRLMQQNGTISQADLDNRLRSLMILDDDQNWWMMGTETDTWYKAQGDQWLPATPDVLQRQHELEAQSNAVQSNPYTMDYLTSDQQSPSSASSPSGVQGYTEVSSPTGMSGVAPPTGQTGYDPPIPVGDNIPIYDNQHTVPNPNVMASDSLSDPYGQPTVAGAAYSNPTVAAQPIDYGNEIGIESPFDQTQPPNLDDYVETPLYDEASDRQRASTTRLLMLGAAVFLVVLFLGGAAFVGGALLWYDGIVSEWDASITALQSYQPPFQSVRILDRQGNEIGVLGEGGNDRREVSINEISPFLIHAVISQEDQNYYERPSWQITTIVGAFWQNLTGTVTSDVSPITRQIARNFVLQNANGVVPDEATEIIVAGELTDRYSKSFLLELYLNEIAFGNQTFGVEAASQFYFDTDAQQLNLAQSAMLASLISAPSANNPVANRELALQLMRDVLQRQGQVGCIQMEHAPYDQQAFCVTPQQVDINNEDSLTLPSDIARLQIRDYRPREFGVDYPHFVQLVQSELERYFGTNEIYNLGYTITTTLDHELQDSAQEDLVNAVRNLGRNGVNTGAIMVTDPVECTILAMVGSPNFEDESIDGQVNGALRYHRPGATIQPLIYAAALDGVDLNGNGIVDTTMVDTNGDSVPDTYEYLTPASILWDVRTTYGLSNGQNYTPSNIDGQFHGSVNVRSALQNGYNIPAVRAYNLVGSNGFRLTAESLGLIFPPDAVLGLETALGDTPIRLYDTVIAYSAFANGGRRCDFVAESGASSRLRTIQSITDADGNNIPLPVQINTIQAMSPGGAFLMNHILSDNQARADQFTTNSSLTIPGSNFGLAAKSGTSGGVNPITTDLWTVGYTTNRVVGVWLGHHDGQQIQGTFGAAAAGPLWNEVMRTTLQGTTPGQFGRPAGSIVRGPDQFCGLTGALISGGVSCPSGIRNEFWLETNPPPANSVVVELQVDGWTGLIANENCSTNIETRRFINVPDDFVLNYLNTTTPGRQYLQAVGLTAPVNRVPSTSCDFNTTPPTINIASPSGGQSVQQDVQITGQASADQFQGYVLEYAPVNTTQFVVISTSNQAQPTANGTLGTWNTTNVPNGDYILRLTMTSNTNGRVERLVQPVRVNNPQATPTPTQPPVLATEVPVTDPNFTPIPFNDP